MRLEKMSEKMLFWLARPDHDFQKKKLLWQGARQSPKRLQQFSGRLKLLRISVNLSRSWLAWLEPRLLCWLRLGSKGWSKFGLPRSNIESILVNFNELGDILFSQRGQISEDFRKSIKQGSWNTWLQCVISARASPIPLKHKTQIGSALEGRNEKSPLCPTAISKIESQSIRQSGNIQTDKKSNFQK